MATDPDEEALAWAGDEPTSAGRVAAQPPAGRVAPKPPAGRVAPKGRIETPPETDPATKRPTPAPLLITYGLIAGLYLIYTVGWILSVAKGAPTRATVFDDIMFHVQQGLAVASPVLWFGAVFLLTRDRKPLVRLLWLLVGLAVVIPWPTVLGV